MLSEAEVRARLKSSEAGALTVTDTVVGFMTLPLVPVTVTV